ncbi:MAG: XRE family transcriptional regulator [Desulfovibrio sp.]|nr:XRE family transcriptional regulator [Desulfovibrio sp.]
MSLDFFDYHNEMLHTNAEYKEAYEALESEFAIARALIKARSEAGMSQSDVAARLGVTQPAVARMESGKNVSIKTLRRYATAVGKKIQIVIRPQC